MHLFTLWNFIENATPNLELSPLWNHLDKQWPNPCIQFGVIYCLSENAHLKKIKRFYFYPYDFSTRNMTSILSFSLYLIAQVTAITVNIVSYYSVIYFIYTEE